MQMQTGDGYGYGEVLLPEPLSSVTSDAAARSCRLRAVGIMRSGVEWVLCKLGLTDCQIQSATWDDRAIRGALVRRSHIC